MINVTELRPGNYFIDEGNLYQVIDILLNKTAMRKMPETIMMTILPILPTAGCNPLLFRKDTIITNTSL